MTGLKKINPVDLIVLLIIVFAAVSYISKPSEPIYRGNQMYIAIQDFQRLDSRGFLVEAEVKGTYLWDGSAYSQKGLLLPSTAGRLRLKTPKGDIVVIGGERAYLEDVAASQINMTPVDNYLVMFDLDSKSFESFSDFTSYIEGVKRELKAERLYLDVEIAIDSVMTPVERQIVVNELTAIYLVRSNYLPRTESQGFVINLNKAEITELAKLSIPEGRIATNRMRAYAGYQSKPAIDLSTGYYLVSAKGFS